MAYEIFETELSLQDLDSILSYIALTLNNPSAASSFADELERCYSCLKEMPLMFERCHDPRLQVLGYRKAVIKNYVMVYKVDDAKRTVNILRFFYGRQNYEKLI